MAGAYYQGYLFDAEPPQIMITSPSKDKEIIIEPGKQAREIIEIAATDNRKVKKVVLYVNNLLAKEFQKEPFLYQWQTENEGQYAFTALAYDNQNNEGRVVDVAYPKSIMTLRSYGSNPQLVAELGAAAIEGYQKGGIIPCAKHFPGLGRALADPHQKPVEIAVDLAMLEQTDLIPFKRAIEKKVEMIMVNHALYPALDAKNPASFSPTLQNTLLRKTFGYQGLILSDDLEMKAAISRASIGRMAVEAIKAGTDLVLICHTPEKQKEVYDALLAAIKSGEIEENRLRASLKRIVYLKTRGCENYKLPNG